MKIISMLVLLPLHWDTFQAFNKMSLFLGITDPNRVNLKVFNFTSVHVRNLCINEENGQHIIFDNYHWKCIITVPNLPLYSFANLYDTPSAHGFNYFKFKGQIV